MTFQSKDEIQQQLSKGGYISDDATAMSIFLALKLQKPILIEGPAGVGKTEIAKMMATLLGTNLIRLQCYEGLDASQAIYEWNYQQQLLYLKKLEIEKTDKQKIEVDELFSEQFLSKRPLLQAITQKEAPVLLIDELDRADEEFESYLLEILSDWQITIPEIGTVKALSKPFVVVTGNRTRELSEALRRRCLYLWIDYPSFEKEVQIIKTKLPEIDEKLAAQITLFMQELRKEDLNKKPGVAESLDWAMALAEMHFEHLDKTLIEQTLGVVLKDWEDIRNTQLSLSELMEKVGIKSKIDEVI
ncbi:AAA family ATPase [Jiulongibacter sp. NS-SX5]|uniref:AAA family ATPase n=1 Tax=Jiulongibacter sp. NS-SX5 TaxID=3463854 RepID=UPI0040580A3E